MILDNITTFNYMARKDNKGRFITSVRLPENLFDLLRKEAKENYTSLHSVVLKAIDFYFRSQGKLK